MSVGMRKTYTDNNGITRWEDTCKVVVGNTDPTIANEIYKVFGTPAVIEAEIYNCDLCRKDTDWTGTCVNCGIEVCFDCAYSMQGEPLLCTECYEGEKYE